MKWGTALIVVCLALSGCGEQRTGLHVTARVSGLQYDELRFGVTAIQAPSSADAGDQVLVDPALGGRYMGPFRPGDQDVFIYLSDALDGEPVRCDVTALRAAAPIAAGSANVMIARHAIKDVEVLLLGPGSGGSGGAGGSGAQGGGGGDSAAGGSGGASGAEGTTGAAGTTGAGTTGAAGTNGEVGTTGAAGTTGSAGTTGAAGAAGTAGTSGQGGSMPPPPPTKVANGSACAVNADCMSAHCVAGLCCDSACDTACKSCALSGSKGVCGAVAAGAVCSAATCADAKNLVPAATCTDKGMCTVPKKTMCGDGESCTGGVCQ